MPSCLRFLLFATLLHALFTSPALAQQDPEFRGIWVDTWHDGFKTAAQIDQLILDAQRGNLNAIFPQVRRRGDAFYNSTVEPKSSAVSPSSFDPLAYLIQKARAASPPIEVHAWIVVYPLGSSSPSPDHILNQYPDWLMQTSGGSKVIGGEYWADPAHPDVQQHTLAVALDIIGRYNVDGFHFDYIRYPGRDSGYNPVSVARFNKRFGRSGQPGTTDSQWLQFRRDAVTELVRRVYLEAVALKPGIKLSAATIGQGGGITSTSQWTSSSAYAHRLQDWRGWMQEGILDLNVPMLYYDQQGEWAHGWTNWNIFAKNHKYNRHLAIGPGWYLNTVSDALGQIRHTRQPTSSGNTANGSVGYHYFKTNNQGVSRTQFLNALSSSTGPFSNEVPTPEMPWKASPTRGHLKGIVSDSESQPFEWASVTVSGPVNRTLRTDGNGFYGVVDLPPGTYSLTASMPDAPYSTESRQVAVTAGEVATANFTLVFEALEEIILDNPDARFSGSWGMAEHSTAYGPDFAQALSAAYGAGLATATYRPLISIPGRYDIYTWYVAGGNRATNVAYTVSHSAGQETLLVDQQNNGGEWRLLASDRHYAAGTDGYVQISNSNTNNTRVIADAVRFTLVAADPDPADFFEDPLVFAGAQSASITWETVEPAVVRVEYGLSRLSTTLSSETTATSTEHSVSIAGLQPASQYHLRLHARAGTSTYVSNWTTFETAEATEVIVDNRDSGVSFSGSWSGGGIYGAYFGDDYHRSYSSTAAGPTATFRPNLPVSGIYDVYTWHPSASSYSHSVPHLIQHADGQNTVMVDQRSNGGEWRLLLSGRRFNAGTAGFVRITHPATGHTMADAQRWVLHDPPLEHTLTTSVLGSGGVGRSPGAATYEHGETVQLTADPASGWVFTRWAGDIESEQNPASIKLYRDREVTAVFHQLLELTAQTSGEGTVEIEPEQTLYPAESEVQVLAIPAKGWSFTGWSGDEAGQDNPVLVWMDDHKTVIANFGFAYDAWAETVFTPAEQTDPDFSGSLADPLGHGFPNLLKYAFGIGLREPERVRLPSVTFAADRLRVSFYRLRHSSDLQYQLEISADLITWKPANALFSEVKVEEDPDGRTERVTLELDAGVAAEDRQFVRLRVEQL